MTVSWDDSGGSPLPGTYFANGASVAVGRDHIAAWTAHPAAVFNTAWFRRGQAIGAQALTDRVRRALPVFGLPGLGRANSPSPA